MNDITLISPDQLSGGESGPFPIEQYALRFLAQGDSWFSIGAIPPFLTSNLFDKMSLSQRAIAVNCAQPGAKLVHMTDTTTSAVFLGLLCGAQERTWDALLLSGLGNDVISASQAGPSNPPDKRIFATAAEWPAGSAPSRYLSSPGWESFSKHANEVFEILLRNRGRSKTNKALPIVLHTYDFATPRNAGAGLGFGPWLFKAVKAFNIPQADWAPVAVALQKQVRALIMDIAAADSTIRVVDTQGTLVPAATTDLGPTKHWQNEIHPTRTGYRLLGDVWEKSLEKWFVSP